MEVIVKRVLGDDNRVEFGCKCGSGIGIWEGSIPNAGERRFVELALRPTVVLGKTLLPIERSLGLSVHGNLGTEIVGKVIEVGEDGYVRIDYGCGQLDLEAEGTPPVFLQSYMILTDELRLFDINY